MSVSDNSTADGTPRVDEEIPGLTIQTLFRQLKEQANTILSQRVDVGCSSLERMKLGGEMTSIDRATTLKRHLATAKDFSGVMDSFFSWVEQDAALRSH